MKAIIVEDEKQAVVALSQEIRSQCPYLEIVGHAATLKDAEQLIKEANPDIVFLDIQLKDGNGFDLLERFESPPFKVIFTTAFGEYALKAIKFSALDYLLKPIDSQQLKDAVEKARQIKIENMQAQISALMENQRKDPLLHKIALQTSKGIFLHELSSIIRIQSEGNYAGIYLTSGRKLIVSKTLKDFEEMLSNSGFVRIHHSHLINLEFLESYISKDGGYVVLSNKESLPVSKRKRPDLLKILNL